jgi:FkbM family methyltransferase
MIKIFLKKILKNFNLKLIKLNVKKPIKHPFPTPGIKEINIIKKAKGILHIGGHRGTEAAVYDWFNKSVIWIEADPYLFDELEVNIKKHYNQKAYCALLGDKNISKIPFYISNNDGACSSIFEFSENVINRKLWKDRVFFTKKKIYLEMITLDTLVETKKIKISNFDHWIIDIQGAELLALKGAKKSLKFCKSIQIEVSKKEYYKSGANWKDVKKFLYNENYKLIENPKFDHTEVLFIKQN